jgi:hypothetical protein
MRIAIFVDINGYYVLLVRLDHYTDDILTVNDLNSTNEDTILAVFLVILNDCTLLDCPNHIIFSDDTLYSTTDGILRKLPRFYVSHKTVKKVSLFLVHLLEVLSHVFPLLAIVVVPSFWIVAICVFLWEGTAYSLVVGVCIEKGAGMKKDPEGSYPLYALNVGQRRE